MKERVYNTYFDNQVSAEFKVYQGESNSIRENILLGSFVLYDIPAAPVGEQKLKVCFNIDSNGIFNVSAEVISKCIKIEEKNSTRTEYKGDNSINNLIHFLGWLVWSHQSCLYISSEN